MLEAPLTLPVQEGNVPSTAQRQPKVSCMCGWLLAAGKDQGHQDIQLQGCSNYSGLTGQGRTAAQQPVMVAVCGGCASACEDGNVAPAGTQPCKLLFSNHCMPSQVLIHNTPWETVCRTVTGITTVDTLTGNDSCDIGAVKLVRCTRR